jgi:hypothetical protein
VLLFGAVMKRTALALTLILGLLISAITGTLLVSLGKADPYVYEYRGEVLPKLVGATPPIITILSPKNNNTYGPNISLYFNISVGDTTIATTRGIREVYYQGDWEQDRTCAGLYITEFSCNLTVPEGKHKLTVWANEEGEYRENTGSASSIYQGRGVIAVYSFHITGSISATFTVDTSSPNVSVLSVENKTYGTSEVPLDFTVNELFSQITYSLDGLDNVTVAGNATLTGLSDGEHNITVYATDIAGHTGVSETVYFSVKVAFPTALVATASGASAAIIGIGLLVYFKKRKR